MISRRNTQQHQNSGAGLQDLWTLSIRPHISVLGARISVAPTLSKPLFIMPLKGWVHEESTTLGGFQVVDRMVKRAIWDDDIVVVPKGLSSNASA
ncbi:hypothetical protein Fmac_007799 [Flemingia macrophylla]|uniref:Uncharacterized protein n=1 Tax=Flemingia macrophylla TaxID=520843 RepID=A0ABD1MVL1_9FABA